MVKRWIDLDALNWLPENPVYFYPLLRKQFTSTININKYTLFDIFTLFTYNST
jgi:hypothetical protein